MQEKSFDFLPDIVEKKTDSEDVTLNQESSSSKNLRGILPENCVVCGNRAIGYHYDVPSCNGCKAFFRRTIITGKRVFCKKGNKCLEKSKPESRKLCPGCRFTKCEQVGMNPLNIRTELTKNGNVLKEELLANQSKKNISFLSIPKTNEVEFSDIISKLTMIENSLDNLFNASMPSCNGDLRSLSEILRMNPILEVTKIPNLTILQNELFPVRAGFVHNICLSVVEFTKMFESFFLLSDSSIQKLIRHGLLMCGALMTSRRSIRKFNSDALRHPDGAFAGKPSRSWNGIWVEHKAMIHKVLYSFLRIKLNDVEFLLLKAIVICNPAVADIPENDVKIVEKERFKYARCLLNYCLREYGSTHGPDRFSTILSMISVMESQQKEEKGFYIILRAYFQPANFLVSPLYDEIMAS